MCAVGGGASRCLRIFFMTSSSSMKLITLMAPEHLGQVRRSTSTIMVILLSHQRTNDKKSSLNITTGPEMTVRLMLDFYKLSPPPCPPPQGEGEGGSGKKKFLNNQVTHFTSISHRKSQRSSLHAYHQTYQKHCFDQEGLSR